MENNKKFEEFKDVKEVRDIINELNKLDELYCSQSYNEMLNFISSLMNKYLVDTLKWNMVNQGKPQTYKELYMGAHNFLVAKVAKVIDELSKSKNTEENKYE